MQYSAAAAMGVALGSCGQALSSTPGVLRRTTLRLTEVSGVFGYPTPFAYIGTPGYLRMINMFDTLLWEDGEGNLLPWLAESHSASADKMTYTFQLRSGLLWSDGQPVTAEDVAFTFNYFNNASLTPLTIAQAFGVNTAQATGPLTVQVQLAAPSVTFEKTVAGALPIVPKHVWSAVSDPTTVNDTKYLVGTGPYRMTSYDQNSGNMSFAANDAYFLGKPFIKELDLVAVGDEFSSLRANAIDLLDVVEASTQALVPFRADSTTYHVIEGPPSFTYPLFFNLSQGGPLADVKFRQAVVTAINRSDMVQRLLGGQGAPGNPGFLPPSHPDYTQVTQYSYSVSGANAMLDAAGYTKGSDGVRRTHDGSPLSFKLYTENSPVPPSVDLIVADLKAVGVNITVQSVDLPSLFGITVSGKFDMALTLFPGPGGTSVSSDPDYLRLVFSSHGFPGPNRAVGYKNSQFDALAEQQQTVFDSGQRKQLIAQMQRILAQDLPAIPLYYGNSYAVARKSVYDNLAYTPGGFATGITSVTNKQLFITGQRSGLQIVKTAS
ncbi:MAG TPA: ABC transporter substrate-binding protein [Candidatus Dormibacteraeota bacterium]